MLAGKSVSGLRDKLPDNSSTSYAAYLLGAVRSFYATAPNK